MDDQERIAALEAALIRYVERYGFIDEARAYYLAMGRDAYLRRDPDAPMTEE